MTQDSLVQSRENGTRPRRIEYLVIWGSTPEPWMDRDAFTSAFNTLFPVILKNVKKRIYRHVPIQVGDS